MNKVFIFIVSLFLASLFTSCISSRIQPEITSKELYQHIKFLADSSLKGRYPGTIEDKKAANYIAKNLNKDGLELLFDNGFQSYDIIPKVKAGKNNSLSISGNEYKIYKDYTPVTFTANKNVIADIIFVGFGFNIKQGNNSWNDYEGINVSGKWVLILRGEPINYNGKIPFKMYSSLRSKTITAKDHGAAGVIFVSGKYFDKDDELIEFLRPEGRVEIPVIHIKRSVANIILKETGKTIEEIEPNIIDCKNSFAINQTISCQTDLVDDIHQTYNIAAQLTNNPTNKYIVVGAHYDHLGLGGAGTGTRAPNSNEPHYGADDNASGVASMLEIAEKLLSKKDSLKNNFIFVAFGAEEMGLIGSKYFVSNLPIADTLIKAMINIDMVGRMKKNRDLQIGGIGTSIEGESIIESLNYNYNFKLGLSSEGYGPSDHSSFYSKDIPVFFFSTGPHIDYHTPGDSLGNINFTGLTEISNYIYDLAFNLASKNEVLTFQEAGPKSLGGEQRNKNLKVKLGIMPDFSGIEKQGLRTDIVIKDKPAYKAGMRDGDIITAIDGYTVSDVYEYMDRLSKLKPGQIITVEVIRNEKKEVLIIQL